MTRIDGLEGVVLERGSKTVAFDQDSRLLGMLAGSVRFLLASFLLQKSEQHFIIFHLSGQFIPVATDQLVDKFDSTNQIFIFLNQLS